MRHVRFVPTIVHGVVDYLTATLLFFLPYLLQTGSSMQWFLTVMALLTLAYSLLTYYEAGAWKWMPMRWHLALDVLSGVIFVLVAALSVEAPQVRGVLALIGAFEILFALVTIPEPFAWGPGVGTIPGRNTRPRHPGL